MKLLIEKDVEIPMRDGVILRADIYRPDDGEEASGVGISFSV